MSAQTTPPRHTPTVGILSIGDMGAGIARLLITNGFRVVTNVSDRRGKQEEGLGISFHDIDSDRVLMMMICSQATQERARSAAIELVQTDLELVNESEYILSIVPPRDALDTARRIIVAATSKDCRARERPLYFLDLNAISPRSAREIHECFSKDAPDVRHIDGGIIGGPPHTRMEGDWYLPKVPVSSPHQVADKRLAQVLNLNHLNSTIGSATGLKMCFAALSKGFTALAIQSFTTAHNLEVLPELKEHLEWLSPATLKTAERGLVSMPPKAYRWVKEMEEIAETFEADGGFVGDESPFRGIARVYELVAQGTELGEEKTDSRVQGKTSEDVARLMAQGTNKRKEKVE